MVLAHPAVDWVAFGLCIASSTLIALLIFQHLRHYTNPNLQRLTVRVLLLVPCYAATSYLAFHFRDQAVYWQVPRDCYEAWAVYSYLSLVLTHLGGPDAIVQKSGGKTLATPSLLCTCVLVPVPVNSVFMRRCIQCCMQLTLMKCVAAMLTLILALTGDYGYGRWVRSVAFPYITVTCAVSYFIAGHWFLLLQSGVKGLLQPVSLQLKFFCFNFIVFLTFWQTTLISIIVAACHGSGSNAMVIAHFTIAMEMTPIALLMCIAFPYGGTHQVDGITVQDEKLGLFKALLHVVWFDDVVAEISAQFGYTEPPYALSLGYSDEGGGKRKRGGRKTVRISPEHLGAEEGDDTEGLMPRQGVTQGARAVLHGPVDEESVRLLDNPGVAPYDVERALRSPAPVTFSGRPPPPTYPPSALKSTTLPAGQNGSKAGPMTYLAIVPLTDSLPNGGAGGPISGAALGPQSSGQGAILNSLAALMGNTSASSYNVAGTRVFNVHTQSPPGPSYSAVAQRSEGGHPQSIRRSDGRSAIRPIISAFAPCSQLMTPAYHEDSDESFADCGFFSPASSFRRAASSGGSFSAASLADFDENFHAPEDESNQRMQSTSPGEGLGHINSVEEMVDDRTAGTSKEALRAAAALRRAANNAKLSASAAATPASLSAGIIMASGSTGGTGGGTAVPSPDKTRGEEGGPSVPELYGGAGASGTNETMVMVSGTMDLVRIRALSTLDHASWEELHVPGKDAPFVVRGATYLKDRKKIPAERCSFTLASIDIVPVPHPMEHIARFLPTIRSSGMPFGIIIHITMPGSPLLAFVASFVTETHPDIMGPRPHNPTLQGSHDWTPFDFLLHRFVHGDRAMRNMMLKLIPHIEEGPWMIRQAVGVKPVIIGKALKTTYFEHPQYIEIDIDISANAVANYATGLVRGATKKLIVDMGFVLEGIHPWELPEVPLGTMRLNHLDLTINAAKPIGLETEIPMAPPVSGPRSVGERPAWRHSQSSVSV